MVDAHRTDFTLTRFGIPCPPRYRWQSLDTLMTIDHVIRVLPGRMVTEPEGIYAPDVSVEVDAEGSEVPGGDAAMTEALAVQGWDVMNGYSSQYGYSGPVMHASEFIGGAMADDILDMPGVYAACAVECDYPENVTEVDPEPAGWLVVVKDESDPDA